MAAGRLVFGVGQHNLTAFGPDTRRRDSMYLRSETLGSLHQIRCDLKPQFAGKTGHAQQAQPIVPQRFHSGSAAGGKTSACQIRQPVYRIKDPAGGKVGI